METELAQGDTCVGRLILTTSYFDPSPLDCAAEGALGRRSRRTSQEPPDETTNGDILFADLDSSAAEAHRKKDRIAVPIVE